ncbi:MAG: M1 family aminopeptidase [Acidobacteriota bacterium]
MKQSAPKRILVVLCAVLGLVQAAAAQPARPDFNRPQTYDVQHYLIRVRFDRPAKKVLGDTTVTLTPLKTPLSQVTLDSAGINYQSVALAGDGTSLKYKVTGDKIAVTLPKAYQPGETVAIQFKYSAVTKKGVYFVDPLIENGVETRSAQIWTQGEAEEARHWFPSFDFPSDKATTEQFITANIGETVIANGELLEKSNNADGTVTFHYKMPIPHSTYLLSFVIGKYAAAGEKYGEIPLGYYVYPGKESLVPNAFGKTKDILRTYEELTGVKFPYNKYDQTIVAGFTFGGMENITATTLADSEVFLADYAFAKSTVEDLVSHEAAHSWFGDLVTCKNWAELWLNEGFATYMEAAYREKMYGRENYMLKIRNDAAIFMVDDAVNQKRNGLFNEEAADADKLFDRPATTYNKGGVVLHMLREEIGTEAFWKAVNSYLNAHKFGNVETSDLKNAMEEASGRDLGWFFDQWVYGTSYPKMTVRHTYDPKSKTLKLTVTQTQKADRLTPSAFRIPMDFEFKSGGDTIKEKIDITKRVETFSISAAATPTDLKYDPLQKIPLKTIKTLETAKAAAK